MNEATHDQGAIHKNEWAGDSHWLRRSAAVTFCLLLVMALGVVFTRVIGARIPEQRATLEKLITDRTGLVVRFDNVHFAWDLDGTSAVFTRVELTDPRGGRVRVVAPELRVEFDSWDFLRHHQFSLGHVTLSSPDIEITDDPVESVDRDARRPTRKPASPAMADERDLVRRYLRWAELMPIGRIEVEGARVHLLRRGERAPRHSFTLSQAVVSRGTSGFNGYGTCCCRRTSASRCSCRPSSRAWVRARTSPATCASSQDVCSSKLPFSALRGEAPSMRNSACATAW